MNYDLETILDECLNQIEDGKSNIDECLVRHPEHAAQLKPLLTAATTLARGREVMPAPAFKARDRMQLNLYMQEHPQPKRVSPLFWRFTIGFVTMLFIFVASGTAFAQRALPGDAFYNWKLTSEHVWRITSSDQLEVNITLSNRRVGELVVVSGDEMRQARAIENYEKLLVKFKAAEDTKDRERILAVLRAQHEALVKAGVLVPELEIYFPR